ncbi:Transcription factor IIIA [Coemansia erecta]|uniref:Transcription factor IIIA n=1 Tax=Coemansia erecta TaxID=147472 RepID=A0A9W7XZP1_9FUNG|nr:Transcription factor IIIA [Coemansia erecta]
MIHTVESSDSAVGLPEAKRQRTSESSELSGLLTPTESPDTSSNTTVTTPSQQRPKNYKCAHCPKTFTRPCRLTEHENTHTGERPFLCMYPGCNKAYTRETHLAVHARTHSLERKYPCTQTGCSAAFNTNQHLKRHLATHETSSRPFACTYADCTRTFAKRNQLHVHVCSHTGELPYACSECSQSFKYPSQLQKHRVAHTEMITYHCAKCSQSFGKWSELQAHRREHGPKWHACDVCGKEFKRRHMLGRHLLTHDPERPMFCCSFDECSRFYLDENSLDMHVRAVHDGERKRYACESEGCGKSFAYRHTLRRHAARAHGASADEKDAGAKRTRGKARKVLRSPTMIEVASGMAYANPEISGRTHACTVSGCPFRFKRAIDLEVHLGTVHGQVETDDDSESGSESE